MEPLMLTYGSGPGGRWQLTYTPTSLGAPTRDVPIGFELRAANGHDYALRGVALDAEGVLVADHLARGGAVLEANVRVSTRAFGECLAWRWAPA